MCPSPSQDSSLDPVLKPTRFRWLILLLISALYLICYMDRGNLGVALPEIGTEFGLNKTALGLVLAVFTWAYAIAQIPASWLGDRFGPRRVLVWIMSVTNVATIMTGAAFGRVSLLSSRLLLGLGEAGAFPVASRAMQLWFAKSERGRIQGITHFFSRLAVAITPLVAGSILIAFGWRAIFYIFGSVGVIWSILFYLIFRNSPEEHSKVNSAELARIRGTNPDGTPCALAITPKAVPWKSILTSRNMLYIAFAYGCFFFGTNFYLTWYPTYLREYRHLSLQTFGLLGSVPLIAGMIGDIVGGSLSDILLAKTGNSKLARRAVAAPGFVLAGVFIIPAAMTENTLMSVSCLAASFFFLEWVIGPAWAVPMDVGGQFSGTVTGIMNMAGALAASLTPIIYGGLFNQGMWIAPFFVSAGVMMLGALIWVFLIDPTKSVVEAPARQL
jgi:sugar phosphate permease